MSSSQAGDFHMLGARLAARYMAPEALSSEVFPASDVWAAGVMAYQLLSGYLPFDDARNRDAPALSQARPLCEGVLAVAPWCEEGTCTSVGLPAHCSTGCASPVHRTPVGRRRACARGGRYTSAPVRVIIEQGQGLRVRPVPLLCLRAVSMHCGPAAQAASARGCRGAQVWKAILTQEPQFRGSAWAQVSGEAKDFVRALLNKCAPRGLPPRRACTPQRHAAACRTFRCTARTPGPL